MRTFIIYCLMVVIIVSTRNLLIGVVVAIFGFGAVERLKGQ